MEEGAGCIAWAPRRMGVFLIRVKVTFRMKPLTVMRRRLAVMDPLGESGEGMLAGLKHGEQGLTEVFLTFICAACRVQVSAR